MCNSANPLVQVHRCEAARHSTAAVCSSPPQLSGRLVLSRNAFACTACGLGSGSGMCGLPSRRRSVPCRCNSHFAGSGRI